MEKNHQEFTAIPMLAWKRALNKDDDDDDDDPVRFQFSSAPEIKKLALA